MYLVYKYKNLIVIFLIVIFLAVLGLIMINLSGTGKLTVTSDKNNEITVNSTLTKNNGEPLQKARGKLTTRLKSGNYYIQVSYGDNSSYKYITIDSKKDYKETLNLANLITPENVITESSWSIAANKQNFRYLSSIDLLNNIDSNNNPSSSNDTILNSVKWANADLGVAQDKENNFFIINNGSLKKSSLPGAFGSGLYKINISKNGTIYLWSEKSIYTTKDGTTYTNVYNSNDYIIHDVLPSDNNFVVITASDPTSQIAQTQTDKRIELDYTINLLNLNGSLISKKNEELYTSAISKNGDYLALTNDKETVILNTKLQDIALLPNSNVNNLTWLNDSTLIYSVDKTIYKFDTKKLILNTLAIAPANSSINYLALSDEMDTLYLVATNDDNNIQTISKLNLTGKPVDSNVVSAGFILPTSFSDCHVQLINFTKPVILMTISSKDTEPYCKNKTTELLNDNSLDINKFSLILREVSYD